MLNPKVSIVIPVYNGGNYMRQAIESALDQTYNNFEVIIVNDGSCDNGETEKIALSYGGEVRYFAKPNGGVASALNTGIENMEGEYFSWLSHDDLYLPEKLEEEVKMLLSIDKRDAIIYSNYSFIDTENNVLQEIRIPDLRPNQMCYFLLSARMIHGCTLLIPKEAFDVAGLFPVELPTTQDYTLFLRLTDHYEFYLCPQQLVKGRQHEEQGSRTMGHHNEVSDFYSKELKRLTNIKMAQMFSEDEIADAWVHLDSYFRESNLYDCFKPVFDVAMAEHDESTRNYILASSRA